MNLSSVCIEFALQSAIKMELFLNAGHCGNLKLCPSVLLEPQENTTLRSQSNGFSPDPDLKRKAPVQQTGKSIKKAMSYFPKQSNTQKQLIDMPNLPPVDVSSLRRVLVDSQTNEKIFQCTFCNYETKFASTIKRHIELKHLPQRVSLNCLQCDSVFKLKQHLKAHYMRSHGLLEPAAKAMMTA